MSIGVELLMSSSQANSTASLADIPRCIAPIASDHPDPIARKGWVNSVNTADLLAKKG